MEREREDKNAESGTSGLYGASQEDEYWSQQQRKSQGQPSAEPPASRMPDVPQSPQGAPTDDARRKGPGSGTGLRRFQ